MGYARERVSKTAVRGYIEATKLFPMVLIMAHE